MEKQFSKTRKIQFRILMILFPFIILFIFEMLLRLAGYGNTSELFFKPAYIPEVYLEDFEAYNKYQNKENHIKTDRIENQVRNIIPVKKEPEVFRAFLVGGSAAQGFPYNSNCSFSKIVENAIKKTGKFSDVEVVNLGVSAISSYAVRDIARKAIKYDPDMLIIYAGNNEYYGTYSYSTGGTHFTRNAYMRLYDLKLLQMVYDFVSLFKTKKKKNKNEQLALMKEQFNNMVIPVDETVDQTVAANFIKNIKSIVKRYNNADIPVLLVEPVCNLVDMPPFKGENDNDVKKELYNVAHLMQTKNFDNAQEKLTLMLENKKTSGNANILFIDALLNKMSNEKIDILKYWKAKESDIVPFRPRGKLTDMINSFGSQQDTENNMFHYLPLKSVIEKEYGDTLFSNDIFIDHVHFNQNGHRIIGEIITCELTEILQFNKNEVDSVQLFFSNDSVVFASIYSLPMYRLFANKLVNKLLLQPPFSDMVIPFVYDDKELNDAINLMGKELAKSTLPLDMDNTFIQTINYYLQRQENNKVGLYFEADRFMFPGSYHRYVNLGRYYKNFPEHYHDAEKTYAFAYLLSGKKENIYQEVRKFYIKINQPSGIKEFDKLYGKAR